MNTKSPSRSKSLRKAVWAPIALGLAVPVLCSLGAGAFAQSESDSKAMPAPHGFMPTATVADIMEFVVMPAAQRLWDSVSVNVTEEGIIEKAPETDEEWAALRGDALTLAELSNALMIPGRQVDKPGAVPEYPEEELSADQIEELREDNWEAWVAHSQVLHAAVMQSVMAIDARDKDALSEAGGTLDEACESCHLQFWYPPKPDQQ
jgi:hypothetical protein